MKSEELPVGWPWRFLMFSALVATTVGVGAFGLAYGYRPLLNARLTEQDTELKGLGAVIPKAQQDDFITFYSQLANLESLLGAHVSASPLFGLIESRTNSAVSYLAMEVRVPERTVVIEGLAANYQKFAEQLQSFSESPEVENVIVNDSNALDGKVKFRVTITVKRGIFKE